MRMLTGEQALEPYARMAADDLGQLCNGALAQAAHRLEGRGFGAERELEHDAVSVWLERREQRFVDKGCIAVALKGAGRRPALERCLHLGVAHQAVVDVGRKMDGCDENLVVRDVRHVVRHRRTHVVERPDRAVSWRACATDRRRALRAMPPTSLELVERRIVL